MAAPVAMPSTSSSAGDAENTISIQGLHTRVNLYTFPTSPPNRRVHVRNNKESRVNYCNPTLV